MDASPLPRRGTRSGPAASALRRGVRPSRGETLRRAQGRTAQCALLAEDPVRSLWDQFSDLGEFESHVIDTTSQNSRQRRWRRSDVPWMGSDSYRARPIPAEASTGVRRKSAFSTTSKSGRMASRTAFARRACAQCREARGGRGRRSPRRRLPRPRSRATRAEMALPDLPERQSQLSVTSMGVTWKALHALCSSGQFDKPT